MFSDTLRPAQLMKHSLLISIIDGSVIDLKLRNHLQCSPPRPPSPAPLLGKRSLQAFDYIKKKYINPIRNFNRRRKAQTLIPREKTMRIKEHVEFPETTLKNGTLCLHNSTRSPQGNGNLKKTKFKLENIARNVFVSAKRSGASPIAIVSTMSFQSNSGAKKTFFPSFSKTKDIENKANLNILQNPQIETPKLNPNSSPCQNPPNIGQTLAPTRGPKRYQKVLQAMLEMYQMRLHAGRLQQERAKFEFTLSQLNLRLSNLGGFQNLLTKFLQGEVIRAEDLRLSDLEVVLFLLFLVKKKFRTLDNLEWNCESLNELRAAGVNKRSEQNYKIILKRFFKKVILDFNRRRRLNLKDDFEFYRFHFAEISEKLSHDWRKLRFETVFNEKRVCFSVEYQRQSKKLFARILKRSEPFMNLLEKYLTSRLEIDGKTHGIVVDYMPILKKKIFQLIGKWAESFKKKGRNLEERVAEFVLDKMRNNKVKLPWSLVEIEQGVSNVRRLFQRAE